ncbi:MAG TPA: PilZ domain-containing protein [Terracidiphilus sp.]|nr:PilZ domain-containing protein [Terracidiphilus sp.]
MSDGTSGTERRTARRYGCAGDAEIVVPGRGLRYSGRIGNLSAGGCFIEVKCSLERGTAVEVWMNAEGQPLRVAANLLARREGGVGCRFHSVTPRKVEQIRILIAELEAEAAQRKADEEQDAGAEAAEVIETAEETGRENRPVAMVEPRHSWPQRFLRRLMRRWRP